MRYGQLKFGDFGQKKAYPSVAPTFVASTTFVTAHDFCQFISTTFVNLTAFVNFCQLRAHQFCHKYQPLMSLRTRSLLLSTGPPTFVARTFFVLSMNGIQSHFEENCFYLISWFLVNQILPTPICLLFTIRETT